MYALIYIYIGLCKGRKFSDSIGNNFDLDEYEVESLMTWNPYIILFLQISAIAADKKPPESPPKKAPCTFKFMI